MNAITALDLEPIKVKLMHQESGEGWSLERATAVEREYRRFLTLMKKYPHEATSPLVDVDTFWHYHILDTMKYAADCQTVFGYFLHHFPYIGMRGEADAATLQRLGQRMQQLYEAEFGEPYLRTTAPATAQQYGEGATLAAAYCGMTTGQAVVAAAGQNAYCGMLPPQASPATLGAYARPATAYCGMTTNAVAYCGMTTGQAAQSRADVAYCGMTTGQAAQSGADVAYCGMTTGQAAQSGADVAYCGMTTQILAAQPGLYTERPTLS